MPKPPPSQKSKAKRTSDAASIRSSALLGADQMVRNAGSNFSSLLERSEIHPDAVGDPEVSIGLRNFMRFWEEFSSSTNETDIGAHFGLQFDPRDLGLLGYVFYNCPNLRSALKELSRLFPIHQENSLLTFRNDVGQCGVEYQVLGSRADEIRQDAELSVGMIVQFCRAFLGPTWAPEEVHFQHNKPQRWRTKEAKFKAPIYFGQPTNGVYFSEKELSSINPNADPGLLKLLGPIVDKRLESLQSQISLVDKVRHQIDLQIFDENISLQSVSRSLGVSFRTLQRRLGDEELSFSDLVDDARCRKSLDIISNSSVSITEASYQLGYSDSSAFARAFKRWHGATPRDFRRRPKD